MFFYFMINVGSLSLMATTELEYHKGFWAAYLLPFSRFFWIAVVTLIFGKKQYIQRPIGDKVIAKSFKVCWILTKNKFDFNAAKPSVHPEKNYPWNDKFVDEIRELWRLVKSLDSTHRLDPYGTHDFQFHHSGQYDGITWNFQRFLTSVRFHCIDHFIPIFENSYILSLEDTLH